MSTPEEQMATAVQQLKVRLQQPGMMGKILQAERDDLAKQVQSATSTTTQRQPRVVDTRVIGRPDKFDGDPLKHAHRLFRLRSYLGAADQRYQLEPTTTEASSTPRLNATLSSEASCLGTQMYTRTRDDNDKISIEQVSQSRGERGIPGQETVRDGMGAKTCWTPDERVVLQTQRRHTDKVGGVRKTRARESIVGNC